MDGAGEEGVGEREEFGEFALEEADDVARAFDAEEVLAGEVYGGEFFDVDVVLGADLVEAFLMDVATMAEEGDFEVGTDLMEGREERTKESGGAAGVDDVVDDRNFH